MKKTLCLIAVMSSASIAYSAAPLKASRRIMLPGAGGHFDFMSVDAKKDRLLAAHKGAGALVVLDMKNSHVLASVPVGEAQGVAVDEKGERYFAGDAGNHKVVIVDSRTLKPTGEVKTDGPVDAIAYDPKSKEIYADEDDGDKIWVIDPSTKKIQTTIHLSGVPEYVEYDSATNRVYQNIKTKDEIAKINPSSHQVEATWSTLPARNPHGLAIDKSRGWVFSAGSNGKVVAINVHTGKVLFSASIAPFVDQIAYDPSKETIYCACRGVISVVKVTDHGLKSLGRIKAKPGAHTLAVNSVTHTVWVSYASKKHSYLQKFEQPSQPVAEYRAVRLWPSHMGL